MQQATRLILQSAFCYVLAVSSAFGDDASFLSKCPFKIGDSLAAVQKFYDVHSQPEPMNAHPTEVAGISFPKAESDYFFHFPKYGVWIFFNGKFAVKGLRFESPFRGKIAGVGVGDKVEVAKAKIGNSFREGEGMVDSEEMEDREKKISALIDELPDPAPKVIIRSAIEHRDRLMKMPTATLGRLYLSAKGGYVTVDFSKSNKLIKLIFSGIGTD